MRLSLRGLIVIIVLNKPNALTYLETVSLTLMMGSFLRKSQTTHRDENVDAKICWT
jgi:hypothetical protein